MKDLLQHFSKKDKILIFLCDSMGELDYLAPLINKLNNTIKITIIFFNPFLYEKYIKNQFYSKLFQSLNIKILNKFKPFLNVNLKNKKLQKYFVNFPNLLIFFFFSIKNLFWELLNNKNIFIENSGRPNGSKILNILFKFFFFKKYNFFLYPHGCVRLNEKYEPITIQKQKNFIFNKFNFIVSDDEEKFYYNSRSITGDPYYIDFPPNSINWKNKILELFKKPYDDYFCIFLNRITIDDWGNAQAYEKTLFSVLEVLKKIKSVEKCKFVFKRHNRYYKKEEEDQILNKLIKYFNLKNYIFSDEAIYYLSAYSLFNICINSNSIYSSYSVNKNSIFYFQDTKDFRIFFPHGHRAKYHGLPYTSNEEYLKSFIELAI